jgi:D-inositol-3-phosphate glycosyltransferase
LREPWDVYASAVRREPAVERIALLSVHTCPLDQPGTGDSGGMNVYVRQVARRLAEMGVQVDVFTRASGQQPRQREMSPGVRVIHLEAGPDRPVPKEELQDHLCEFLYSLMSFESAECERLGISGPLYDAVHSHYWLSGWVGRLAAERWDVPLIQSFHTLGRVKNLTLHEGDTPEPTARLAAEERIIETAQVVLAPTDEEAKQLVRLYGADPARVRVVAPGVDTDVFTPGDRSAAKASLGLAGRTVVLFVGRLQLLKSPDIAVQAVAELARRAPETDPVLVIVGGPSGRAGLQPDDIAKMAADAGIADRVIVHEPVEHRRMPELYRAADVQLVPSRTESFGLVALEASACGTPVVATDVGGLRTAVWHGHTGLLVAGDDPCDFAEALERIVGTPEVAAAMGESGAHYARRFDWRQAAAGLLSVYEEQSASV